MDKKFKFSDNQLDKVPILKLIKEIEKIKDKLKPSLYIRIILVI